MKMHGAGQLRVFGGSPRIHAGGGALQRSGKALIMRFSAGLEDISGLTGSGKTRRMKGTGRIAGASISPSKRQDEPAPGEGTAWDREAAQPSLRDLSTCV